MGFILIVVGVLGTALIMGMLMGGVAATLTAPPKRPAPTAAAAYTPSEDSTDACSEERGTKTNERPLKILQAERDEQLRAEREEEERRVTWQRVQDQRTAEEEAQVHLAGQYSSEVTS